MPNTTRGYPTPSGTDNPDIPADFLDLATAINNDVATVETAATNAATAANNAATTANNAVPKATVTAKGDILVGTANATVSRKGVGNDNEFLIADSAEAIGVKWGRSLVSPFEKMNIVSSAPVSGTNNIDGSTSSVWYFTANTTTNFGLNFRWTGLESLNSVLGIGQSLTTTVIITQGATAYLPTSFLVDGTAVAVKWQGGTAPVAGDANALNVFQFGILKTAISTFTVLGSVVRFG